MELVFQTPQNGSAAQHFWSSPQPGSGLTFPNGPNQSLPPPTPSRLASPRFAYTYTQPRPSAGFRNIYMCIHIYNLYTLLYVIVIYPTGYNLYNIYMIINDYLHVICCTLQTPILTKIPPNRSLQQTHLTHIRKTPVPPSFSILCATSLPASTAVGQRHILAPKNVDSTKSILESEPQETQESPHTWNGTWNGTC